MAEGLGQVVSFPLDLGSSQLILHILGVVAFFYSTDTMFF